MLEEQDAAVGRRQRRQSVLENAKAAGLEVATIIDVGFAKGTEGLYGIFENAHNFLLEPIAEMEPAMVQFCQEHPNSSYMVAAATETDGSAEIVARRVVGLSGFHSTQKAGDAELRTVPTVRLDTAISERALRGPFLIKMDVEGHELHVLRGAVETLKKTEMVILEVTTWGETHKRGVASLMDVFSFMDRAGFVFYDFIEPVYRPLDNALYGFDGAWVRADSSLRRFRSFRSPEAGAAKRKHRQERDSSVFAAKPI